MSTINNTTLLATTSTVASLDVLAASAALAGVHVDRADLLTQAGTLTASSALPAGSYDSVVVQSDAAISDAASWLGALGRCLKPTGTLIISGAHQVRTFEHSTTYARQHITRRQDATLPLQLKLAGFVNIQSDSVKVGEYLNKYT